MEGGTYRIPSTKMPEFYDNQHITPEGMDILNKIYKILFNNNWDFIASAREVRETLPDRNDERAMKLVTWAKNTLYQSKY